jgi:hypothetical protein
MSAAIRWPRWPDMATRSGCWPGRVSGSRRPLTRWGAAGADAVVGDVSSAAAVEHAMVGCDAVVHVASVVSFDPRRAAAMQQANPAGTGTVLEAAQRHGLDPIVYVSPLGVFLPATTATLTAGAPVGAGIGPYTLSKIAAERVARHAARRRGGRHRATPGACHRAPRTAPDAGRHRALAGRTGPCHRTQGWLPRRMTAGWSSATISLLNARGEAPVTAERGKEMAAAASRGHLRASHGDREQVIAVLKAAFVQGRLTKDELDARVGRAFAAWTYADLATLTADLPPGLTTAPTPGRPARARTRPPLGKVAAGATLIGLPPTMVAATFLTGSEPLAFASALVVVFFFMAWMVAGTQMLANWHDERSRGQLPPRRTRRGQALEGEQGGGIGGDLMHCEARRDVRARHVAGHGAIRRAWRSPPVRRDQRRRAGLQVTA